MIAPPKEVLEFLKTAHDEFQPLSEKLLFDAKHPLHRNTVSLYGSLIELTGSCIHLVDRGLATGVPVILRSALEAYIDLINLIQDPDYGNYLEASFVREELKMLEEAKDGKNQYLSEITKKRSLKKYMAELKARKKSLAKKGFDKIWISKKFAKIKMTQEYKSIYGTLCRYSHNNLSALVERHLENTDKGISVVFYKELRPEDSAIWVGINAELLVRATEAIHDFLNSPVKDEVQNFRSELDKLRGESDS